jgi:soluble cytochrome b562
MKPDDALLSLLRIAPPAKNTVRRLHHASERDLRPAAPDVPEVVGFQRGPRRLAAGVDQAGDHVGHPDLS